MNELRQRNLRRRRNKRGRRIVIEDPQARRLEQVGLAQPHTAAVDEQRLYCCPWLSPTAAMRQCASRFPGPTTKFPNV